MKRSNLLKAAKIVDKGRCHYNNIFIAGVLRTYGCFALAAIDNKERPSESELASWYRNLINNNIFDTDHEGVIGLLLAYYAFNDIK